MTRSVIHGEGIQGMSITLNCADMCAAETMFNQIQVVISSRNAVKEYKKTPYDKRKELYPDGEPASIEFEDKQLEQLSILMRKLFCATVSATLFDADDNYEAMPSD